MFEKYISNDDNGSFQSSNALSLGSRVKLRQVLGLFVPNSVIASLVDVKIEEIEQNADERSAIFNEDGM